MLIFGKKKEKAQSVRMTLADVDPELSDKLDAQDKQLKEIHMAEEQFENTGDIGTLIEFWEGIWDNGGLLFIGSKWAFRLPDLYIKIQDYDNALKFLRKIKNPAYKEKANSYIEKVAALKAKKKRQ